MRRLQVRVLPGVFPIARLKPAMPDDAPHFDDAGRLIAPKYGDVYFSAEDGLAETHHVFLEGNRLAERLAALQPGETFTIGETGFGTGLNFLAAWQLFDQHAPDDATLHFVSVEGFPLHTEPIRKALSPWPQFAKQAEAMLAQWGGFWAGTHRLRFAQGRIRLTLLIGEAADALASLDASVDAWFLDGFAPSRNPAMWSDEVFQHIGRCSKPGTTLATYTAAGFVRRGLHGVGFEIEKQPGFGTKRDMTVGRCESIDTDAPLAVTCKATRELHDAVVIGGSIAGSFTARALAERGVHVTVLESQQLINGELPTLSPRVAVLQPKINDINDATGQWLRGGYADAYRLLCSDDAIAQRAGWQACGTFQAAHDERSTRRLRRFIDQFGGTGLCRWIEPLQTALELGVALPVGGVVVERAGLLRPAGLCAALLDHPQIKLQDQSQANSLQRDGQAWVITVNDNERISTDTLILASALDTTRFDQTNHLTLKPVRGQVTVSQIEDGQTCTLNALRRPMFYGGYALPVIDGKQSIGASFVPGDRVLDWRDSEHTDVCDKLARVLPDEADRLRSIERPDGWVGLRTTTPKHRCYAEQIEDGLYVSLGHGSHGIASAAAASEHLASMIAGGVRIAR